MRRPCQMNAGPCPMLLSFASFRRSCSWSLLHLVCFPQHAQACFSWGQITSLPPMGEVPLEVQLESSSFEQQTQPHGGSQVLLDNTVYCPLTERSLKNDTKHWRHAQSACRLSTTLVFPAQEGLRLHIPAKTHCPKI